MMGRADGIRAGGWTAVAGIVVGVVLLASTVSLIRINYRDRSQEPQSEPERELRLRLARGEIDVDDFLREESALEH